MHTHPFYSGYGDGFFSPEDKSWSENKGLPVYLYSSNGALKSYDYTKNETKRGISYDLPKDPKFIEMEKNNEK